MLIVDITITYQRVYGEERPIEDAKAIISELPLFPTIMTVSQIGLFLYDPGELYGKELQEDQRGLFDRVITALPEEKRKKIDKVFSETDADIREGLPQGVDGARPVIFNSLQLTEAAKLALKYSKDRDFKGFELKLTREQIGELVDALLIINDHLTKINVDLLFGGKPDITHLLAKSQQFAILEHPAHYLCRWRIIIHKAFKISRERFPFLELEKRYRNFYCFSVGYYQAMALFLYLAWHELPRNWIDLRTIVYDIKNLRDHMLKIDENQFTRLLQEFCEDTSYFKRRMSKKEAMNPWNTLRLLQKPVLREGDGLICINENLIAKKGGEGFYYGLIDLYEEGSESDKKENELREQVRSLFGYAFEEYVSDIFERVYGFKPNSLINMRFTPGKLIPEQGGKRRIDGVINYGDSLIILEYKSSLLPLDARIHEDPSGFQDWKRRHLIESGAGQINDFIQQIKTGELDEILGIDHERVHSFYPLVITLQVLPTSTLYFMQELERDLREEGLLQDSGVWDFEVMHISSLEVVEVLIKQGKVFKDLIEHKIKQGRYTDWHSFLFNKYGGDIAKVGINNYFVKKCTRIKRWDLDRVFDHKRMKELSKKLPSSWKKNLDTSQ